MRRGGKRKRWRRDEKCEREVGGRGKEHKGIGSVQCVLSATHTRRGDEDAMGGDEEKLGGRGGEKEEEKQKLRR